MSNSVPEGMMERLEFSAEDVPEKDVLPRIPADLPVVFSPGDEA